MTINLYVQRTSRVFVGETDVKREHNLYEGLLHATACRQAEITTIASRAAVAISEGNFLEDSFAEDDVHKERRASEVLRPCGG